MRVSFTLPRGVPLRSNDIVPIDRFLPEGYDPPRLVDLLDELCGGPQHWRSEATHLHLAAFNSMDSTVVDAIGGFVFDNYGRLQDRVEMTFRTDVRDRTTTLTISLFFAGRIRNQSRTPVLGSFSEYGWNEPNGEEAMEYEDPDEDPDYRPGAARTAERATADFRSSFLTGIQAARAEVATRVSARMAERTVGEISQGFIDDIQELETPIQVDENGNICEPADYVSKRKGPRKKKPKAEKPTEPQPIKARKLWRDRP